MNKNPTRSKKQTQPKISQHVGAKKHNLTTRPSRAKFGTKKNNNNSTILKGNMNGVRPKQRTHIPEIMIFNPTLLQQQHSSFSNSMTNHNGTTSLSSLPRTVRDKFNATTRPKVTTTTSSLRFQDVTTSTPLTMLAKFAHSSPQDPNHPRQSTDHDQQTNRHQQQQQQQQQDQSAPTSTASSSMDNRQNQGEWHSAQRTFQSTYSIDDSGTGYFNLVTGKSQNNDPMQFHVKRGLIDHFGTRNVLTDDFLTKDPHKAYDILASRPDRQQLGDGSSNDVNLVKSTTGGGSTGGGAAQQYQHQQQKQHRDHTQQNGNIAAKAAAGTSPVLAASSAALDEKDTCHINTIKLRPSRADSSAPTSASASSLGSDFDPVVEMEDMIRTHHSIWSDKFSELHRRHDKDDYKTIYE